MLRIIQGVLPLSVLGLVMSWHLFASPLDEVDRMLRPFRDAVYDQILEEDRILDLHRDTISNIHAADLPEEQLFRGLALGDYYLGRFYQALETTDEMRNFADDLRRGRLLALRAYYLRREPALAAYRRARITAEAYFNLNPCAESHRVLGEILGQTLLLGTVGDALSIGGKAEKHVDWAREADPTHRKAMIQEASRYAYSPEGWGSDPQEARRLYAVALEGADDREDLFNIYGGLGMAAFMDGDDATASGWFRRAAELYPGNVFARGMLIYLEEGAP